jgi:hypothetical protein
MVHVLSAILSLFPSLDTHSAQEHLEYYHTEYIYGHLYCSVHQSSLVHYWPDSRKDERYNIPPCVTKLLVGWNEPIRNSISRECLLYLRSYWLIRAHQDFRHTGRDVSWRQALYIPLLVFVLILSRPHSS